MVVIARDDVRREMPLLQEPLIVDYTTEAPVARRERERPEEGGEQTRENGRGKDAQQKQAKEKKDRGDKAKKESEDRPEPCPMCGGYHKGSYCQMPPRETDYVR